MTSFYERPLYQVVGDPDDHPAADAVHEAGLHAGS